MRQKLFYSDVHLATSTDELRPAMCHVCFKNGFLYATDAHIAVKQSLKIHDFTEDEIALLEGKLLHGQNIKAMKRYKRFEIQADGVLCIGRYGESVLFKFDTEENVGNYPNVDAVISFENGSLTRIGINASLLAKLDKCLVKESFSALALTFGPAANRAIIVTTENTSRDDQLAVIMPVQLSDL